MILNLPSGHTVRPGKILCIGRNYAAHVREMGDVADLPVEPVVFLKPSTALIPSGGTVILPSQSNEVHHELELVVVIGEGGRHIPETEALNHEAGHALLVGDFPDRQAGCQEQPESHTNNSEHIMFCDLTEYRNDTLSGPKRITPAQQLEARCESSDPQTNLVTCPGPGIADAVNPPLLK